MVEILDKKYAKEIEAKWQKKWADENAHSFNPETEKKVYSIDTPPPFTSGTLHMGHIFNHVWIDIIARYKRMRGFEVYLPQGFDCHGLPTELKVEKEFGVSKENREEFLEKCIEWTNTAIKRMRGQFDSIGYSSDWGYTYRTMDDDYNAMVQRSLVDFYQKGLLYREKHPILWCPKCGTALAKAEVGHVEQDGKLYHLDLLVEGHKLTIATTRPEMMPACVAVMVHPADERYKKYVGKEAEIPIFGQKVPIIADDAVDKEFATGVVYVCTFGDEQDISWQKKYNLPVIEAIEKNGHMSAVAGKYAGMYSKKARKAISEDLVEDGHIRKIEDIKHSVTCHVERSSCSAPIELLPMEQWFIKVKEFTGDIKKAALKMNWQPDYMRGRLEDWADAMDWDWIISRQRVFGTPIPFWVCGCGNAIPSDSFPVDPRGTTKKCGKCGKEAAGEKDVCDCWVDSSITPLRISKWKVDEKFFRKTYPASLRPQGYEIIRTWTFYTIFRTWLLTGKPCFKDLVINGMVAGPDGRKMSKSLGNVIEPEEPLKKYSADTLRQWAAAGTLGDDYPFSWEECEHSQKFLIKLWNVSKFIEMHLEDFDKTEDRRPENLKTEDLPLIDRWILSRLNRLIETCTEGLEDYRFNAPLDAVRSFIWHDLADDYIEMVKHRLYKPEIYGEGSRTAAQYTLGTVLETCLRLLAPVTPHIADEIHDELFGGRSTCARWPDADKNLISDEAEKTGEIARGIVGGIRKHKSSNGISLGADIEKVVIKADDETLGIIKKIDADVKGTGKINNMVIERADVKGFEIIFG